MSDMKSNSRPLARSFPPIADVNARALVLGSMPGVASLEAGQYYAHPRNAFWPIMGELFGAGAELPYPQRCDQLRRAGLALWDVLQECRRQGSLDTNIERDSEQPNDFADFLARCSRIERIYFNGQKAETAFRRHVLPILDDAVAVRLRRQRLPSTSPAHAGMGFDNKLALWRVIQDDLSQ